jgi:protein disulfide-isomerase A1
MRFSSFVSSALALASLAAAEGPSDVLDLTQSTFDAAVNGPLILVEFFAPWCGHCKALAPHYEEAATELKGKNIPIAKVDCVEHADLCQAHGVQGYPTIKVYRDGKPSDYNGPRKADGIIGYMIKQSLPAVTQVTSDDLETFQKADKIVAIAYVASSTDAPAPAFSALADKHRDDYLFGLSSDAAAAEKAGVTPPALVLYRAFDEPKVEYPYPIASATPDEFAEWITELAVPLIDEVSGENYQVYANSGKPLAYLFVDPTDENKDKHIEALRPVAALHKGHVNFVWIDAIKFGDHAKGLNLDEAKWPSFVIQDLKKQLKYPYEQGKEIETKVISDMVQEYRDGKLLPHLKSAAVPETQDESVYTLVGKNYEEIVDDDSKDMFIEFYAPWCGHCKRLGPIWSAVGDHFAPINDKVLIAKMDATENDLPASVPFSIAGFPTIKFKAAGSKEYVDYEGERTLEGIIAYVEENAKNSLVGAGSAAPKETSEAEPEAVVEEHDEL